MQNKNAGWFVVFLAFSARRIKMRKSWLLLLLTLHVNCFAAPSITVTPGHPRVYLNPQRVAQIQSAIAETTPLNGLAFPQRQGTVAFNIYPTLNPAVPLSSCGGTYVCSRGAFDDWDGNRNHIYVREIIDTTAIPQGSTQYQVVLQKSSSPGTYIAVAERWITLTANQWHKIMISWDSDKHTAALLVDDAPWDFTWSKDNNNQPWEWTPADQNFIFSGRDVIDNIEVYNGSTLAANFYLNEGQGVDAFDTVNGVKAYVSSSAAAWVSGFQGSALQFSGNSRGLQIFPTSPLKDAWLSTLGLADDYATRLTDGVRTNDIIVDVASGGWGISEVARVLGIAYLVKTTDNTIYSDALFKYADQLLGAAKDAGGEFSQSGRIEAMAVIYDWLFIESGSRVYPPTGLSYRTELATAIRETLRVSGTTSIQASICGSAFTNGGWLCDAGVSSPGYAYLIGGHSIGGHTRVLAGALAIVGEAEDTDHMSDLLATLYDHYFDVDPNVDSIYNGIYTTRAWINVDGGSQMGWAYSTSGHTDLDSVKLWQIGTDVAPAGSWQSKQFLRYVYGLRGDNHFPASGDVFGFGYTNPSYVPFLLWAAANGSASEAPYAQRYYNTVIRPNEATNDVTRVNELLFWQGNFPEAPLEALPYSKLFTNAGQVLMRNSWDYPNATLLEFKSTSFWNENHHHLDQNAFTIFYKAPLLIDSGYYGGFDEYGSAHWQNYYTRTIAHNTVTVWDPAENFVKYNTNYYSNDGGQQFIIARDKNGQPRNSYYYPLLEDIQSGGSNHFDGVTAYEYGDTYTYVRGNASKAYSATKLDQTNGFLRDLVFLRSPGYWAKPITVVFDKVTTATGKGSLTKRFLLHSVNEPEPLTGPGITTVNGNTVTIRNGEGMLFAQTLLPVNPVLTKFGGQDASGDHRFLVQVKDTNGNYPYQNFGLTTAPSEVAKNPDVGAWRVEVGTSTSAEREYFLHVLSVADNDGLTTQPPTAQNLSNANAAVALLANTQTIAFNKGDDPATATNLSWNSPIPNTKMIISGLKPNTNFDGSVQGNGLTTLPYAIVLAANTAGPLRSSAQGVLVVNSALPFKGSDLTPTALSASRSGTTKVLVSDTVKNQGNQNAGGFAIRYYLSTNTTYEPGTDVALASSSNGTGTCNRTLSSLNAGKTSSVSNKTCYKPNGASNGVNYYVLVVDDARNQVVEYDEGNNVRATVGTIRW